MSSGVANQVDTFTTRNVHDAHWISAWGRPADVVAALGTGNQPRIIVLTCAETGFAADQLANSWPGEVYVIQNIGGVLPEPQEQFSSGTIASLRLGLQYETVGHLVVCGHVHCQCVPGSAGKNANSPAMNGTAAMESHILRQLEHGLAYRWLRSYIRQRRLQLHAWLLQDDTARIRAYSPVRNEFILI